MGRAFSSTLPRTLNKHLIYDERAIQNGGIQGHIGWGKEGEKKGIGNDFNDSFLKRKTGLFSFQKGGMGSKRSRKKRDTRNQQTQGDPATSVGDLMKRFASH